jgi:hypothetical protein
MLPEFTSKPGPFAKTGQIPENSRIPEECVSFAIFEFKENEVAAVFDGRFL